MMRKNQARPLKSLAAALAAAVLFPAVAMAAGDSKTAEPVKLADAAGLIRDPDMAAARMSDVLRIHGVG